MHLPLAPIRMEVCAYHQPQELLDTWWFPCTWLAASTRSPDHLNTKNTQYYAPSQAEPPEKPSTSKGFLKWLLSALYPLQWLANGCLATWGFACGICHWFTWLAFTCLACIPNMLSLNVALLGVHFDLTLWCLCYRVLSFWVPCISNV